VGGSAFVERLTYDLARQAWAHIAEVEQAGGMAKAIDAGIPSCGWRRRRPARRPASTPAGSR